MGSQTQRVSIILGQGIDTSYPIGRAQNGCVAIREPHALRECALVAALEGQEAKSRRYFDESLRIAEEHQARYERAKTLLARAEAGIKFGWAGAEQQSTEARDELNDIEEPMNTDP